MTVSEESYKNARQAYKDAGGLSLFEPGLRAALTAALPFPALRPAPSQSDEERVREIVRGYANNPNMGAAFHATIALVALVRAEATLAGAAAEREECAKLFDTDAHVSGRVVAATIRARNPG